MFLHRSPSGYSDYYFYFVSFFLYLASVWSPVRYCWTVLETSRKEDIAKILISHLQMK